MNSVIEVQSKEKSAMQQNMHKMTKKLHGLDAKIQQIQQSLDPNIEFEIANKEEDAKRYWVRPGEGKWCKIIHGFYIW